MAVNEALFRELFNAGLSQAAALKLSDPAKDTISGAAVTDPAAMTAPATFAATYTAAESEALRADVAALRTTVINLLTSLRDAGVVNT